MRPRRAFERENEGEAKEGSQFQVGSILVTDGRGMLEGELVEVLGRAGWRYLVIVTWDVGQDGPPGITVVSRNSALQTAASSADLSGGACEVPWAPENVALSTYEDPDDGTIRVLC